jgi:predicted transposase/invertase (TIGR01784 family)
MNELFDGLMIMEEIGDYDTIDKKHDKGFKYLLSAKKIFLQLLRTFVEEDWVEKTDKDKIYRVNKSFILQDFKEKEADLVYFLKLNGHDTFFYILMEMQSTVDYQMPLRLLLYMIEIWREYLKYHSKESRRKNFKIPAIIPIVLYNGKGRWTVCKSFKEYQNCHNLLGNHLLDFEYILLDINRYSKEELLRTANLISTVFLIERERENIEELFTRLEESMETLKNLDEKQFDIFKNWFTNIIARTMPKEKAKELEKKLMEGKEGNKMMVSNLELLLKKEFKKNRAEGRAEGIERGRVEGIEQSRLSIAKVLVAAGVDIEVISKATNLSIEEIEKLGE